MTERGKKHLQEILHEVAGEVTRSSNDPWPVVRERLANARSPWRRFLPKRRVGWGLAFVAAVLFGASAYATAPSEMVVTDVTVERAVLQEYPGQDRVEVTVRAMGRANLPWCSLTHGSSYQETTWFDEDLTEQRIFGDVAVFTFFEDTSPSGPLVDPARVPFTAACDAGTGPGGEGPGSRYDDAHVEGTARGDGAPWPYESREFVRKDMEFRQISPPASTLTSNGETMTGEVGTYCWSPGRRDPDETALWCWDELENMGIPGESKTLAVTPGSTLIFDFGGGVKPDYVGGGAFPISHGRVTGAAPTDLRVGKDGRIPIPEDMRAGEYAVAVGLSGTQGEAEYSFRIDVRKR